MKNNFISSIWDFRNVNLEKTNYITHDFFRWYGKLIPQLVSRLIKLYSRKGDLVLANFAGSGTVLLEANVLERNSIGVDSSPLSVLLCRVKTTPYIPDSENFLLKLGKFMKSGNPKTYPMNEEDKKWFNERVFQGLMNIKNKIDELKNEKDKNYYLLALVGIVRKVSMVDSRCVNHIVVDKKKPILDVFSEFKNRISEMNKSMNEFIKITKKTKLEIHLGDARRLEVPNGSVDFIISHPPYLGCIHYSNIYKLANRILGYKYEDIKKEDISTNSLPKYMEDMKKVFDEMYRVLKPEKYAAVVIGDNRKDGNIIPTFSYFISYASESLELRLRDIFIWIMSQKAGMNVKRRGNHIDHNYILIFQKPKKLRVSNNFSNHPV